jgi:hypothetical protein
MEFIARGQGLREDDDGEGRLQGKYLRQLCSCSDEVGAAYGEGDVVFPSSSSWGRQS